MMNFDIRIIDRETEIEHVVDWARPAAKGQVTVDTHREIFYCMLGVWQCEDYERQWREATLRLSDGVSDSCFVVSVDPPSIAQFLECWFVWRLDNEYRVQNQSFFFDETGVVDPRSPYDAIWPYRNTTKGGERIYDDWGLPLDTFLPSR